MRLGARVSRLERTRMADGPCPECGHGSGEPPKFIVSIGDEPYEQPDPCPRCGQPRLVVIKLTYGDPKEPEP